MAGLLALAAGVGFENAAGAAGEAGAASVTVPVTPFRILDTRNGTGTGGVAAPLGPNGTLTLQVAGVGTVPAGASGVVLNITTTEGTAPSFVTAWPTGEPRPEASVLNVNPGQTLPNRITASLGGGRLDFYNFAGSVHLVADVAAYLLPGTGAPGPTGPTGPAGPRGLSAWDVIPSSVTVTGGFVLDTGTHGSVVTDVVAMDLPGVAPVDLLLTTVNFAADPFAATIDDDPACTGTYLSPTAPPGKVCIYYSSSAAMTNLQGLAGVPSTRTFRVAFSPSGTEGLDMYLYASWAYTAL